MDLGLLHSFIGKRFKQPLVLIQSDDWGLNRNGTAAALQALAGRYPEAVKTPMQGYDILESEEDVGLLRQVLEDTAAVMTCNAVMANVDFEKTISVGKFVQEGVVETYRRIYGEGLGGYEGLKAGQEAGVFDMQFHGGVHLQYRRWMEAVAQGDLHVMEGLRQGVMGVSPEKKGWSGKRGNFMAALDWHPTEAGYTELLERLLQAYGEFEGVWDKQAKSFIAPAYIWDEAMETMLVEAGIDVVQGLPYQLFSDGHGGFKRKHRRMVYTDVFYTLRNCYFEPGENYARDYVGECLKRAKTLISWGVPVVINSHRFNYMGGVSADHRAHGLKELNRLIEGIRKHWPEAQFVGTEYFSKA